MKSGTPPSAPDALALGPRIRGGLTQALAIAATGWCLLLVVGAFVYPAWSGVECGGALGGPSECVSRTATEFAMNGWPIVLLLVGVATVAFLVSLALYRVCTKGSRVATAAAWTGIALLFAFSWVTGLSIGVLVFPAVVLLAAAAVVTPRPMVR